MSTMVLCITREALKEQGIPYDSTGIFNFDLTKLSNDDFNFINRKIVDDKHNEDWQNIGFHLPQMLPYIAITDGQGRYLSYSRNGTEKRLHGSRSIGIGGHIDIYDLQHDFISICPLFTISMACFRELKEEIDLEDGTLLGNMNELFTKVIVDTSNKVGKVHVGLFAELVYPNANPQEELYDSKWITVDELKTNIDEYESWSKLIIEGLN